MAGLLILTYGFLLWLMLQLLNVPITTRLDSLIKMPKFSSWPCSVMWAEDKGHGVLPLPWRSPRPRGL